MATENSSSSFGAFPQLVIDQSDISGSWKKYSGEYLLALDLRKLSDAYECVAKLPFPTIRWPSPLLGIAAQNLLHCLRL